MVMITGQLNNNVRWNVRAMKNQHAMHGQIVQNTVQFTGASLFQSRTKVRVGTDAETLRFCIVRKIRLEVTL